MRQKKIGGLAGFAVIALLPAFALLSANWKIDNNFSIRFEGSGVSGVFTLLKGDIAFDENNPGAALFDVTVDAASINTGIALKNKHAKGDGWLDVAKYPAIRFRSTAVSKSDGGYKVTGTLYLHGIEKQITFPFTFKNNTFAGAFEIMRADYNVGSSKGLDGLIAPNLKITVVVPVSK